MGATLRRISGKLAIVSDVLTKQDMKLRFYTTDGCHLCDEAWALINPIAQRRGLTLEYVEIMDDPQAEARFAESIPVLERSDQEQPLHWPFDTAAIYRFLL